jgi:ribose-phosphate pyrophosphokinase
MSRTLAENFSKIPTVANQDCVLERASFASNDFREVSKSLDPRISTHSVILSASSAAGLTERVCLELGTTKAKIILDSFPNSETRIEVHESVRNRHAFIVASIESPVNQGVMETVLLSQALKLADAQRITVVLPYFPYARQDRKTDTRPPISAKAITDILKAVGVDQIVTIDLHATQIEGFFNGPLENLSGLNQLVDPLIKEVGSELIVVSPDAGGAKRAEKFARQVEKLTNNFTPLVVMSKFRSGPGVPPQVTLSCGEQFLAGKTCVLVDDMIDTGGSIIAAAEALKAKGVARVIVCATHGVFSNNAVYKMRTASFQAKPTIDQIFVTNTLRIKEKPSDFLKIVSISPLLAEAIARLDQPMGTLSSLKERTNLGYLIN